MIRSPIFSVGFSFLLLERPRAAPLQIIALGGRKGLKCVFLDQPSAGDIARSSVILVEDKEMRTTRYSAALWGMVL